MLNYYVNDETDSTSVLPMWCRNTKNISMTKVHWQNKTKSIKIKTMNLTQESCDQILRNSQQLHLGVGITKHLCMGKTRQGTQKKNTNINERSWDQVFPKTGNNFPRIAINSKMAFFCLYVCLYDILPYTLNMKDNCLYICLPVWALTINVLWKLTHCHTYIRVFSSF